MAGLADHVGREGHLVRVLADGGRRARIWDGASSAPYGTERFSGPRPFRKRAKARRIRLLARRNEVKALFADSWKSLEALRGGAFSFPIVAFGHGNEFPARKSERLRRALSVADTLICVSRNTREHAANMMPENLRTEIVRPPISSPIEPTMEDFRYADGVWGDARPRILVLARLVGFKGIDQGIRAVAALKARFPRILYAVAGSGEDRPLLERLVDDSGAAGHVRFLGPIRGGRKTALLRSAELFLHPGRQAAGQFEGSPLALTEAALAGLPVVAGNCGGVSEKVIDGETGLVVDGENLPDIVDALFRILKDDKLRMQMSKQGKLIGERDLWPRRIEHVLSIAGL